MLLQNIDKYKKQLIFLWQEAFSDEESYINLIFDSFGDELKIFAWIENNRVLGALYALDSKIISAKGEFSGFYVYACATRKDSRSRGIMASLLMECKAYAEENSKAFLSLVPGEKSLYDYYSRFGFKPVMNRSSGKISGNVKKISGKQQEIDFFSYCKLKREYLSNSGIPFFMFDAKSELYAQKALIQAGFKFYKSENAVFIFNKSENYFLEIVSKTNLNELEKNFPADFPVLNASYYTPHEASCKETFGMVLFVDKNFNENSIYMNIALD